MKPSMENDSPPLDPTYQALLEKLLPSINAYVRMRTGMKLRSRESISDLVQSTCREAVQAKNVPSIAEENRFRAWLFKIAERKICGKARYWGADRRDVAREVRPIELDAVEARSLVQAYGGTASQKMMAQEELERLESALQRLPEDYREVILLRRVVGLSGRETAEQLGRSEGATRQLFSQALVRLSQYLTTESHD